jgi:tetratricopeptide (TPR) repeat protein
VGDVNAEQPLVREHADSRFGCVTQGLIDKLQQAFLQGQELGPPLTYLDSDTAAVIVAETLEADRLWREGPRLFAADHVDYGPLTDFKRAVLVEVLFGVADVAKELGDRDREGEWWGLGMALLEEIARSPTISPLLYYEDIFVELGRQLSYNDDREAIDWYKRALAHNLRHNEGSAISWFLRELAEVYLAVGDTEAGLGLWAALLRHDPADIWIYNSIALTADRFGLIEIGTEAIQRGLELLDQRGDPHHLRDQLSERLEKMPTAEQQGREAEVAPAVLAELREALTLDFDAGQSHPLDELCRALVPDLDQTPVKRPMTPDDLPLPDRAEYLQLLQPPARKPGRNDPCWCGSGKKYKRCHMRSDRTER